MELEALKQLLASVDINPDEIKDERYATAFRILFSIIEKQNEEIEFFKAENQKLRDEINLGFYAQPVQKSGSITASKIFEMNIMRWLPTLSFFTIFISSANS